MARKKQMGTEIKLYQIDTMIYLGTKNIKTKLLMFAEFLKARGIAIADQLHLNRARALERFDENYDITDIKLSTKNGQANETWLRKNGLLHSVDGRYELSPIANAIIREKISLAEYCFLLLSKQWIKIKEVGGQDIYKDNLLSVILGDLLKIQSIPVNDFVDHVGQISIRKYENEYNGLTLSNQEAARYLIEPLLISGLLTESHGNYVISPNIAELANDYVSKANGIKKIDQVSCAEEEYWNSFEYGFYDIINEENKSLYIKHYPHLFTIKETCKDNRELPIQQIFYGAPGTGKSNTIKKIVDEQKERCYRTTFHPDSDYSTFVGAYKPTMKDSFITKDGVTTKEEKIIYTFCPQAFTNAYVEAWNTEKKVYLVIEEINRGNCAQIFGDLFQLLDRKNGVSEYPVVADANIQDYLNKALTKTNRTDIPDDVKSGKKLMLPSNLYIWATMNTSDQSLFPIDSAFKRRWDWKYIKIKEGRDENGNKLDWKVDVKIDDTGEQLSWWAFIQKINDIIASMTSSADKQLGYFFCCAKGGVIDEETLVSKVIFYLWNDVFKDYGFEDASLFRYTDKEGKEKDLTFPDFYDEDGEKVNTERLTDFVKKVMNWKKTSEANS